MKGFFKSLLTVMMIASAFFIGFQFGKTREKGKIPKFQEDAEGHF